MSSQGSPGGESSTTTVSSVAVQAGDSKIVIAVIKVSDDFLLSVWPWASCCGLIILKSIPRNQQDTAYRRSHSRFILLLSESGRAEKPLLSFRQLLQFLFQRVRKHLQQLG